MSSLYNEYLTGADREAAIIVAESNAQFAKLNVLFEAVNGKLEADMLAAEAKVFTENGTYDDLTMLYTEAEAEAAEKKEGLLKTIWTAIKNLFAKIKNFFAGKNTNDLPDSIEMNAEDDAKAKAVMDNSNKIKSAINKFESGDRMGALKDILAIALPTAVVGGAATATGVVIWKADKIQQYLTGHNGLRNFLDTKIAGWQAKLNEKDNALVDILQKILNKVQSIVNYIFGSEKTIWTAIENAKKNIKDRLPKGKNAGNTGDEETASSDESDVSDDWANLTDKQKGILNDLTEDEIEIVKKHYIKHVPADKRNNSHFYGQLTHARSEKKKNHNIADVFKESAPFIEFNPDEDLVIESTENEIISIFGMEIDPNEETYIESAEDAELLNELSELFAEL